MLFLLYVLFRFVVAVGFVTVVLVNAVFLLLFIFLCSFSCCFFDFFDVHHTFVIVLFIIVVLVFIIVLIFCTFFVCWLSMF